ncbi:MAG: hypothetical protein ONB44_20430 [candidate division KSB1 bacterium]|nr:hypothetical protein [candidate division KSB1 bacterium]MDZ7304498.1 hypothetical protein [candidate division KSB1 bacterium]
MPTENRALFLQNHDGHGFPPEAYERSLRQELQRRGENQWGGMRCSEANHPATHDVPVILSIYP